MNVALNDFTDSAKPPLVLVSDPSAITFAFDRRYGNYKRFLMGISVTMKDSLCALIKPLLTLSNFRLKF